MFTIQFTTLSLKTAFFIKFKVLAFDVQSAKNSYILLRTVGATRSLIRANFWKLSSVASHSVVFIGILTGLHDHLNLIFANVKIQANLAF